MVGIRVKVVGSSSYSGEVFEREFFIEGSSFVRCMEKFEEGFFVDRVIGNFDCCNFGEVISVNMECVW